MTCLAAVTGSTVAELPRAYVDTAFPTQIGAATQVHAGADLQAAIAAAQPGDTLYLQAGAVFTGNFSLPTKSGSGWVIIRSAAPDSALPPAGARLTPDYAPQLPKLVSPNTAPALAAEAGAGHYRLVGLEITVDAAAPFSYGLVSLGSGDETTIDQLPTDIVVDRSYIHGLPTLDVKRGVQLNSVRSAVIDSTISEIHNVGQDTQAIGGWNGPGPYKIVNNELQAAGENVMFGGADTAIPGLVPSDIEIRCNHLDKPLAWKADDPAFAGTHWSVKNLFELKSARRVLVDGNVMEQNWADGQAGWAILLTVRTGSQIWAAVEDVTVTHNIVRHTAKGFEATGVDDNGLGTGRRVVIADNVFDDVDGAHWGGGDPGWAAGVFNGTGQYVINHNTFFQSGALLVFDGSPQDSAFVYTNNLGPHQDYGVFGSGAGSGTPALEAYAPGYTFSANLLAGGDASIYPPGNFFPPSLEQVGFVNRAAGDYHLSAGSPYKGAGTDGKDLGANIDAVNSATRQAIQGH